MKHIKQERYTSFMSAAVDIIKSTRAGWELDEDNMPAMVGFDYEVTYVRFDEPKMTRAEVLMKARAAKAGKQQQEQDGVQQ